MANQQAPGSHQSTNRNPASTGREQQVQPCSAGGMAVRNERGAVTCADEVAAGHGPSKVELDSEEHHRSMVVAAACRGPNRVMTDTSAAVGLSLDTNTTEKFECSHSSVGAAIPVSPPSSPAYVATQSEAPTVLQEKTESLHTAAEGAVPVPETVKASEEEVRLPSGGGGPAPAAPAEILSAPSAPPSLSGTAEPAVAVTDGGADSKQAPAAVSPNSASEGGDSTAPIPTAAAGDVLPPPPVRLGRGRKLCPNCHATAKSAVKQCRECKHVFSPASSRLRPTPRTDPKENEDVAMTSRRRLRPSQRLMEYDCEAAGPSSPVSTASLGADRAGPAAMRRPLVANAANGGGGGANLISIGGGGRPAAGGADGVGGKSASTGAGGDGTKSIGNGVVVPPKRSHKRKNPLPPGVAPPKRKKAAAAAAAAARASEAARQANAQPRPLLCSGLDRSLVARKLLGTATDAGPAVVPSGASPSTTSTAPGPLLFMQPSSTPDDDEMWLPAPSAYLSPRDQHMLRQQQGLQAPGTTSLDSATFLSSTHAVVPLSWNGADGGLTRSGSGSPFAPSHGNSATMLQRQPRGGGIDLSPASQDRDPFEGVELLLDEERRPREQHQRGSGGDGDGAVPAVSLSASPIVGRGGATAGLSAFPVGIGGGVGVGFVAEGGPIEQRVLTLEENMDILGDGDMMWISPMRASSAESSSSSSSNGSLWQDTVSSSVSITGGAGSTTTAVNTAACNPSPIVFRGSPAPDFERVAALASTTTADLLPRGISNMSNASALGRTTSLDLDGLLGEAGPGFEPLSLGRTATLSGVGNSTFKPDDTDVARSENVIVASSGVDSRGDAGVVWNLPNRAGPYGSGRICGGNGRGREFGQHQEAFVGGNSPFSGVPSVIGM